MRIVTNNIGKFSITMDIEGLDEKGISQPPKFVVTITPGTTHGDFNGKRVYNKCNVAEVPTRQEANVWYEDFVIFATNEMAAIITKHTFGEKYESSARDRERGISSPLVQITGPLRKPAHLVVSAGIVDDTEGFIIY